jgi:hypothetical protein
MTIYKDGDDRYLLLSSSFLLNLINFLRIVFYLQKFVCFVVFYTLMNPKCNHPPFHSIPYDFILIIKAQINFNHFIIDIYQFN